MQDWQELVEKSVKIQWQNLVNESPEGVLTQPLYLAPEIANIISVPQSLGAMTHIFPSTTETLGDDFAFSDLALEVQSIDDMPRALSMGGRFFISDIEAATPAGVEKVLDLAQGKKVQFCWDPWVWGLHIGKLNRWDEKLFPVEAFKSSSQESVGIFRFSSQLYHLAGANGMQELGILLATLAQSLRFFSNRIDEKKLFSMMSFELCLSSDVLWNASKLQAMKTLLARLGECYGWSDVHLPVYATPSLRYFSAREPWNNLLRMTLMQTACQLADIDGFRHISHQALLKEKSEDYRLSRNIGLILQKESHLSRVANPLTGSGYNNDLVSQLCKKAWLYFQEIEQKGGLEGSLQSGWLQDEISRSHSLEKKQVESGDKTLVGMNRFASLDSQPENYSFTDEGNILEVFEWWEQGQWSWPENEGFAVKPLVPHRLAEEFEQGQIKSDNFAKSSGERPELYVFCPKPKLHGTKLDWLQEIATTAGFRCRVSAEVGKSLSSIACCVGGDPEAEEWGPISEELKALGYQRIFWIGESSQRFFSSHWNSQMARIDICREMQEWMGGNRA